MSNDKYQYVFWPRYLEGIIFVSQNWKQDGYPNSNRLWIQSSKTFFDGKASKSELWEVKFLGYLRILHLHQIRLSPTDQSDDMDFVEKNATVFAELIQYLDNKSLSLVIRDAWDNRRKALAILREHSLSKGKPKVISLYTELTSLRRLESESITDYIIRAENISNALKEAGEVISDRLLIAMVLKGLPPNFKSFTMVITQKKETLTFSEFKVCLISYKEIENMCYPSPKMNLTIYYKWRPHLKRLSQGINLG